MTIELEEFAPNRWRVAKTAIPPQRSSLAFPMIISDEMPETEQVDGKFYTSKSAFRRVGRSLGLVEVGNEKLKGKTTRASAEKVQQHKRVDSVRKAIAQYKEGRRWQPPR